MIDLNYADRFWEFPIITFISKYFFRQRSLYILISKLFAYQKEKFMTKNNPDVIGVKVLEQNGADIKEIIKQLVYNASVEFTAYYYFTNLRMHCTGMEGEGIKGVIEDARLEDLSHFESCLSRIYELGGSLPNDAQMFIKMSGCEFLQLPTNKTDIKSILEKCLKAEQGAIVNWNKMCKMTFNKDFATYDIAKDILKEEIEHEAWFLELLYGRPSGHMRRKFSGERPHTQKHSRSLG
jgi:ferritin-like protein